MIILLAILFMLMLYVAVVITNAYQEHKSKKPKINIKNNESYYNLIAIKKAFTDNEYLYKTAQITETQYFRNIKKIDKYLKKMEVKYGITKREKYFKI